MSELMSLVEGGERVFTCVQSGSVVKAQPQVPIGVVDKIWDTFAVFPDRDVAFGSSCTDGLSDKCVKAQNCGGMCGKGQNTKH